MAHLQLQGDFGEDLAAPTPFKALGVNDNNNAGGTIHGSYSQARILILCAYGVKFRNAIPPAGRRRTW